MSGSLKSVQNIYQKNWGCDSYNCCDIVVKQTIEVLRYPVLSDGSLGELEKREEEIVVFSGRINIKDSE